MTRIGPMFERVKREGRAALVAYLTAGDPSPERTPELALALQRGGVDLIEPVSYTHLTLPTNREV